MATEFEKPEAGIETRMAWLELGRDDVPPEAVRAMYETLPREVGQACERARKRMGAGYLDYTYVDCGMRVMPWPH